MEPFFPLQIETLMDYFQNGCVYITEQDSDLTFCFRTGFLPVKCLDGNF